MPLLDVDAPAAVSIQKTSLTACYVLLQPSSVEVFKQHLDAKKKYLPPHVWLAKEAAAVLPRHRTVNDAMDRAFLSEGRRERETGGPCLNLGWVRGQTWRMMGV